MQFCNYLIPSVKTTIDRSMFFPESELLLKVSMLSDEREAYHNLYNVELSGVGESFSNYQERLSLAFDCFVVDIDIPDIEGLTPLGRISKAKTEAINVTDWFEKQGVKTTCYFSGNKGFHIYVHQSALGIREPLRAREMSNKVQNALNILSSKFGYIDTGIYDATRKIRAFGSQHPLSMRYKIRADLGSEASDILDLAKERPDASDYEYPTAGPVVGELVSEFKPKENVYEFNRASTDELSAQEKFKDKKCIEAMLDDPRKTGVTRHDVSLRIASHLFNTQIDMTKSLATIRDWARVAFASDDDIEKRVDESEKMIRDFYSGKRYNAGCYDSARKAFCSARCKLFKTLDPARRASPLDMSDTQSKQNARAKTKPEVGTVEKISVGLFEMEKIEADKKPTHSTMARLIKSKITDRIFFDQEFKQWWTFTDIWSETRDSDLRNSVNELMIRVLPDGFEQQYLVGVVSQLENQLGKSRPKANRSLIPFTNGYLNLKTKEFHKHSVETFFDWCLPVAYSLDRETKVIDQIFHNLAGRDPNHKEYANRITILKTFLAATIRGMSHLHKYLELIGQSGAGKTTYMGLATMLVGEKNMRGTSLKTLDKSEWETATFLNKRLVIFQDEQEYGGSGSKLKNMTGGDWLRYEPKGKGIGANFKYDGLVIVSANTHVRFSDTSSAFVRRRVPILISFEVPENEKDEKILEKAMPELTALINQLLDISEAEIKRNLSVEGGLFRDASIESFQETNLVAQWMRDRCEFGSDFRAITNGEPTGIYAHSHVPLYIDFKRYCEREGERYVPSANGFSKQLRSAAKVMGHRITPDYREPDGERRKGWKGIQLKR